MQKEFIKHIKTLNITENSKILLAISGGADSVAMLNLFTNTRYECGIAHCNFHLRDKESDLDEKYVKSLSEKYNFKYFKIDFEVIWKTIERDLPEFEIAIRLLLDAET